MIKLQTLPEALKHSIYFGISMMGVRLVGVLLIPVFTHYLTPSQFARLDLLQSLADIVGMIVIVGLADTLFKFVGEKKSETSKRETARHIYTLSVYLSVACIGVFQIFAPMILRLLPLETDMWSIRLILISVSVSPMILVALSWLRIQGDVTKFVKETVRRAVLQGVLSAVILVAGFGVSGVMVAGMVASVVIALSLHSHLVKTGLWSSKLKNVQEYISYGFPLIFVGIAGFFLRSFDRWMLADSIGAQEMALYALAAKFALMSAFLSQPYQMWFLAKRFSFIDNNKSKLGRYAIVGCVVTVIVTALISAGAPLLIYIMTPQSYYGAMQYVPGLCLCVAIHMCTIYLNIGCYAQTTKLPLIIDSVSAIVVIALYSIFIPHYGAFGAIWMSAIVLSARLIVTVIISIRHVKIDYKFGRICLILATYGIATVLQTYLSVSMVNQALIGAGIVGCLLALSIANDLIPFVRIQRGQYV